MPALLVYYTISWLGIMVNPCTTILVFIVTGLLCVGIKEECLIYMSGGYLSFKTGWVGGELQDGYFPFRTNSLFGRSAIVLFSCIGFDSVTSTVTGSQHAVGIDIVRFPASG